MTCKGICIRYKAHRQGSGGLRYAINQKRCQTCEIFIYAEGLRCPCCRNRLRLKPRLGKARIKAMEMQKLAPVI